MAQKKINIIGLVGGLIIFFIFFVWETNTYYDNYKSIIGIISYEITRFLMPLWLYCCYKNSLYIGDYVANIFYPLSLTYFYFVWKYRNYFGSYTIKISYHMIKLVKKFYNKI
jgi:hypothetical protein